MAIDLFWLLCGCNLAPGPHGRQANIQFCLGFLVSMLKFTASHGPQAELLVALAVFEVGILVKKWGRKFQMPLRDSEMIPKHPHVMLY